MADDRLTTMAARMVAGVLSLPDDDQVHVLALTIRAWCGMRGYPWSAGELEMAADA
jgi:hypothetical protein